MIHAYLSNFSPDGAVFLHVEKVVILQELDRSDIKVCHVHSHRGTIRVTSVRHYDVSHDVTDDRIQQVDFTFKNVKYKNKKWTKRNILWATRRYDLKPQFYCSFLDLDIKCINMRIYHSFRVIISSHLVTCWQPMVLSWNFIAQTMKNDTMLRK